MKGKTLIIGVLTVMYASEYYKQIYGCSKNYLKLAEQINGGDSRVRIVFPDQQPDEMHIDLLILPGGPDLSLALQDKEKFSVGQGKDMTTYTHFYKQHFQKWIDAGVPILGICLGSQAIANHFGVKLIDDGHGHQLHDEHRALQVKDVETGLETQFIDINSRHHQFIPADETFENSPLVPLVWGASHESRLKVPKGKDFTKHAKELAYQVGESKGFTPSHVEAFRHESLPIVGVQWHPEDMLYGIQRHGDDTTLELIEWLLSERNPVAIRKETGINVRSAGWQRASTSNDVWIITTDGSIRDPKTNEKGKELVSPPLEGTEESFNIIRKILKTVRSRKLLGDEIFRIDKQCSVHVHLNREGLEKDDLRKIYQLYGAIEPELNLMFPKSRRNNKGRGGKSYCAPIAQLPFNKAWEDRSEREMKYYSLQFPDAIPTIEFRIHGASVNARKIWNWIRIVNEITDYALSLPVPEVWDSKITKKFTVKNVLSKDKDLYDFYLDRVKALKSRS
jgi:gamma-glutamyl-gamma-aminobutyrate hydrolase PuuD